MLLLHVFIKPAPELGREIEFAVGVCTGSSETLHDEAGLTVDAPFDLMFNNGAFSLGYRSAFFHHDDGCFRVEIIQFIGCKDPGRSAAYDGYVIFFHKAPLSQKSIANYITKGALN